MNKISKLLSIIYKAKLENVFRYNELTGQIEYFIETETVKWDKTIKICQTLRDRDVILIKSWVAENFDQEFSKDTILDAIIEISHRNRYHPIKSWLLGLQWDFKPRLESWLIDYCGAEDNPYTHEVGQKIMIGAVARAFDPGCKFDYMMILEGDQGIGKTTLVESIGGAWYADIDIKEPGKDTVDAIRGAWIIEVSELAGFKKADVESLKAFISRKTDRVRLAYARLTEDFPRQGIFIGTLNPEGDNTYLFDETGGRRFWPVTCSKIDHAGFKLIREQLFAEAAVKYAEKKELYLTNVFAIKRARDVQDNRKPIHPWIELLSELIRGKDRLTIVEILNFVGIPRERQDHFTTIKAGRIMKELGWVRQREGHGERRYFYEPLNKTTIKEEEVIWKN